MKKRKGLWFAVVALGAGSTALGALYNWTGNGTTIAWDDEDNWETSAFCSTDCYPRSSNDDATIVDDCDPCVIDLTEEEIDDLTLAAVTVTFDGNGTETTLLVDVFSAGDGDEVTKLTLAGKAILTNVSE